MGSLKKSLHSANGKLHRCIHVYGLMHISTAITQNNNNYFPSSGKRINFFYVRPKKSRATLITDGKKEILIFRTRKPATRWNIKRLPVKLSHIMYIKKYLRLSSFDMIQKFRLAKEVWAIFITLNIISITLTRMMALSSSR